jgi:peptide/nickel transport system substrate-binding protein
VAWNQKQKGQATRFADKRVRQAMTLLTNRQRMVEEVMLGYGQVCTGPFSPLTKQADPNVKPWPYDPTRAKALLKEAGYEDRNGDGVIEGPNGTPFRFKLTYGSNNRLGERIALFLKDDFARAGIAMLPDPVDWPIMLRKLDERDFDAITLGWTGSPEGDIYQMFHSSQIADKGDDFMSYANAELDQVIDRARGTVDEQKRMPLWRQAHRIIHEDQPYTFLFDRLFLAFYDQRIKNIERSRIGLNYYGRYVMPIPWYVPKDQQKWSK